MGFPYSLQGSSTLMLTWSLFVEDTVELKFMLYFYNVTAGKADRYTCQEQKSMGGMHVNFIH